MKDKVLAMLKNSDGYLSGEELSRRLGVTRAAIWKAISALRQDGYTIDAVTSRGYRLQPAADVLNRAEILPLLPASFTLAAVEEVVTSTNQAARQAAEQGLPDRSIFVAERQTIGRGRRGRTWLSDSREGLWFSLLLRPQDEASRLSSITLFTGLCVAEALNGLGAAVGIKWPNDIVGIRSGRKIGGILTETSMEENVVRSLIIGVGINISSREFPSEIAGTATSVAMECGLNLRRADVLTAILKAFDRRFATFVQGSWLEDYRQHCLTLGRQVVIHTADGAQWQAKAEDIDAEGELVVTNEHGQLVVVRSGEVSVRGLLGYNN